MTSRPPTSAPAPVAADTGLLATILMVLGLLLLGDTLSQVGLAWLVRSPDGPPVAVPQLVLGQASPVLVGMILLAIAAGLRPARPHQGWAILVGLVMVLAGGLTVTLLVQGGVPTLATPAGRGVAQAIMSGLAVMLGTAATWRWLRAGASSGA